jgi:hypothetical protein
MVWCGRMESEKSSTLYMWGAVGFVYAKSHWLFCNLTNMCWKPLTCFGLYVGMVPEVYQHISSKPPVVNLTSMSTLWPAELRLDGVVTPQPSSMEAKSNHWWTHAEPRWSKCNDPPMPSHVQWSCQVPHKQCSTLSSWLDKWHQWRHLHSLWGLSRHWQNHKGGLLTEYFLLQWVLVQHMKQWLIQNNKSASLGDNQDKASKVQQFSCRWCTGAENTESW